MRTSYIWIIAQLCLPLSLLFIVGVLSQGRLLPYALASGVIAIFATTSIGGAGEITSLRLNNMHQDLIIATKTGPTDYMLGEMLANLGWSFPTVLLYLILDMWYHLLNPYNLAMTVLVCMLVLVSTMSMTFCLFSFVRHTRKISALSTILSTLMMSLPPVFYPSTYIPKYLLFALAFLPSTPAAVLEQGLFKLTPMAWYMFAILIADTFVYVLIGRYVTRWREN